MSKIDARKLSREELLAKRQQVIQLHNENIPVMKIVEITGLTWPTVNKAIEKFKADGIDSLKPSKRGRKLGTDRILTEEQELVIRKLLYRTRPNLFKPMIRNGQWNLYLWDRDSVAELIHRKAHIKLSRRCLDKYLQRWGFPAFAKKQRPIDRCLPFIKDWLETRYQEIVLSAARENRKIFWVRTQTLQFHKEDMTRYDKTIQRKFRLVLAMDNRGKEYWLCYNGTFDDDQQVDFLKTLLKQTRSRVVLIRSESKYYTENHVKELLQQHSYFLQIVPPPLMARK